MVGKIPNAHSVCGYLLIILMGHGASEGSTFGVSIALAGWASKWCSSVNVTTILQLWHRLGSANSGGVCQRVHACQHSAHPPTTSNCAALQEPHNHGYPNSLRQHRRRSRHSRQSNRPGQRASDEARDCAVLGGKCRIASHQVVGISCFRLQGRACEFGRLCRGHTVADYHLRVLPEDEARRSPVPGRENAPRDCGRHYNLMPFDRRRGGSNTVVHPGSCQGS